MTLGLTFLSLMSAFWWKNYILNFKKLISLTLRDTLKRTPKVISNQNLFSRLQSWCWFWCWSWCLNFVWKNQAIWLALKILELQGFSNPWFFKSQISPDPPLFSTKFLHFYLKLEIKELKQKMVTKIFNNKISQFS